MKDFFKYITAGDVDRDWGIYLTVVGKSKVVPHKNYPSREHPTGYYFTWKNGRILNEYQLNYITEGTGIFETREGRYIIKPGTILIIKPGVWHRYKPSLNVGWVENYIGFKGELAGQFLNKALSDYDQPLIRISTREEFIDTYYKIFNIIQDERPGFQQIASGTLIKLLGYIISYRKELFFSGKKIEQVIQEARFLLRENIEENTDLHGLAAKNNIGYAYFRKMFKKYIGVSPHQYQLELKIMRAREMLLTTDKSVKAISFELGFQSIHYFSRLFKIKTGINPSELRN